MFVSNRMTPDPTVVSPTLTVAEAAETLRSMKVKRLPVVENGKLVGIFTGRDLREASPSAATSLDKYELNYLLSKLLVKDVMKKEVLTIDSNAVIEEAALIMYKNNIGSLVVTGENAAVAGIITETDIFKSFVDVMGLKEGKTRLTFEAMDQVGVVHDITQVFKDMNINIGSLACYTTDGGKFELVIRTDVKDVKALTERLTSVGYPPWHVVQIG